MKIKNHESILKHKPIQIIEGMLPHRIVLRKLDGIEYCPYVTHRENLILEGDTFIHGEFYWGHYFRTLDEAEKDFDER